MSGCATLLFWAVVVALASVFLLLDEHRIWAVVVFIIACLLTIAWQAAERESW